MVRLGELSRAGCHALRSTASATLLRVLVVRRDACSRLRPLTEIWGFSGVTAAESEARRCAIALAIIGFVDALRLTDNALLEVSSPQSFEEFAIVS